MSMKLITMQDHGLGVVLDKYLDKMAADCVCNVLARAQVLTDIAEVQFA